jgi:endonuclease/exonuclease/phosphatase family metal-dependent hydrolase
MEPRGSPSAVAAPLVLATYNVHGSVGADGKRDPRRIESVIAEIAPDVIALQEFDYPLDHPLDRHDPAFSEQCAGYACVRGPTMSRRGDHYGNVLLSRLPVRAVERIDLSIGRREPRGALDITLDTDGGELRVVSTHFGLGLRERRRQIEKLVLHLSRIESPLIALIGDFNDWMPGRPIARAFDRQFGEGPGPRSFPARFPLLALDRIWVRPRAALLGLGVHRSGLARVASDHLPVVARLARGGTAAGALTSGSSVR